MAREDRPGANLGLQDGSAISFRPENGNRTGADARDVSRVSGYVAVRMPVGNGK